MGGARCSVRALSSPSGWWVAGVDDAAARQMALHQAGESANSSAGRGAPLSPSISQIGRLHDRRRARETRRRCPAERCSTGMSMAWLETNRLQRHQLLWWRLQKLSRPGKVLLNSQDDFRPSRCAMRPINSPGVRSGIAGERDLAFSGRQKSGDHGDEVGLSRAINTPVMTSADPDATRKEMSRKISRPPRRHDNVLAVRIMTVVCHAAKRWATGWQRAVKGAKLCGQTAARPD